MVAAASILLGACSSGERDPDTPATADGKADDLTAAREYEVLLTQPHCDLCTPADKDYLLAQSTIVPRLVQLIDAAQESIRIAQFTWSNPDLEGAVLRAHQRGIDVRIAMNASQATDETVASRLKRAGVPVVFVAGQQTANFTGLQHAKYMLVDRGTLVMGSNNWSSTGLSINDENTIIVAGAAEDPLFAAFECNFAAIAGGDLEGSTECSNDEVRFSPGTAPLRLLRDEIRAAQRSIDVLMHHLVFDDLVKLLAQAAERGVRVRVIVNATDREEVAGRLWERLTAAGGEIRFKRTNSELYQLMHHKLAIIDDGILVNGSGNWSGSAFFNNFEFYWRTDAPDVIAPFSTAFAELWSASLTGASLDHDRSAAEQDVAFTQVFFGNLHAHHERKQGDRTLDDGRLERSVDGELVDVSHEVVNGDPARHAFEYARTHLDFLAITPHCADEDPRDPVDMANMTDAAFDALRRTADAVTKESGGTFLALAGVEWSTNSAGNHVTILGASQVPRTTRGAFDRLYEDFLPARTAANERPIVILNHPRTFRHHQEALNGSWDQIYGVDLLDIPSAAERSYKFNDFGIDDYEPLRSIRQRWIDGVDMPDESVVVETLANLGTAAAPFVRAIEVTVARGKELAGEDPQNPSLTTAEDGSAERFTKVHSDWDYYLRHGMRLAPVASHDNHFANWGAGHSSRTAVIAPRLDALAFADALAARAIYASEDENLELRYYADDRVRSGGSLRTLGDKVQLQVHLQDTDFDGPFRARVYFGTVGGAEVSPVVERDLAGEQWHALEISLPSMGLHFAYIEVHEVGPDRMAWSAPIWIERLD